MFRQNVLCLSGGLLMYLTAFVCCQVTEDLGPAEPTFDTCKTTKCPANSHCEDAHGYVACICETGKTGRDCDLDDPCMENKTHCPKGKACFGDCGPNIMCEGATGWAHCRGCVAGWTGMQCEEDIDECADSISPCLNDGKCKNIPGNFLCKCKKGWSGEICDCQKGTSCYTESLESKGTELVNSITLLVVSLVVHWQWTIQTAHTSLL